MRIPVKEIRRIAMPRYLRLVILVCFGLVACASADSPVPNLPAFAHLRSQAIQSADVDIDIGGLPLGLAGWLSDDHDSDTAAIKSVLAALHTVHVRHYEFGSDFAYSKADVDAVREQFSGPGWNRIAHVLDQKEAQDVDIYLAVDHTRIKGLAIVVSAPRQFTFINTVGSLDLAQVNALRGHLDVQGDAANAHGGNQAPPLLPF
jgi:Domain of unknown function (DUF4252)